MQAEVVIVGAVREVERLSYSAPPALAAQIRPGHRVLVPLRSRRVTGIVTDLGEDTSERLKPILEILEPRPLFDSAHLKLFEFLSTYYLTPLGDVYRSVVPALARVESRLTYCLASVPHALR